MAITQCPGCKRRISDQMKVCPHCDLQLGELSDEDVKQLERRRWRKRLYQAANVTYVAMSLLIIGAIWWWLSGEGGWDFPPPAGAVLLVALGVLGYFLGRGWLFWLRMPRNRP